jgi:Ca2+-binding EF-hand superfamily protein
LVQKCPSNQQEDAFLAKAFKFFDIHNKGEVTFDQFSRAVEKVGVIIEKDVSHFPHAQDLRRIFNTYDMN